ncbi:MAG: hypothetical protein ACQESX_06955, partial [Bacteroidota bacterium]
LGTKFQKNLFFFFLVLLVCYLVLGICDLVLGIYNMGLGILTDHCKTRRNKQPTAPENDGLFAY